MSENRLGVFEMSELTTKFVRKEIRLSEEIYYYMLMQVPQGRLTRDCDIREYLNGIYGATWIDFDILAALRTLLGYSEYMERIVKKVPKHRLVSTQGYVSDGMCIEKLQAEGFTILPPKGDRGERVLDYKKISVQFQKGIDSQQGCFRPNSKRRSMCISIIA